MQYQVAIKRALFFDKVFAGYAGKNLITSSNILKIFAIIINNHKDFFKN